MLGRARCSKTRRKDHILTKQAFCQARAESWLWKRLVPGTTFIAIGLSRSPLTR